MAAFTEDDLVSKTDPFPQFQAWYQEAAEHVLMPYAMCLSTCGADGKPTSRMVAAKPNFVDSFNIYTCGTSLKAQNINQNPFVSGVYYWAYGSVQRQVRLTGKIEPLPREDVEDFVRKLPEANRIAILAQVQDEVISSRAVVEKRIEEMKKEHLSKDIPVPDNYVGYKLVPDMLEFHRNDPSFFGDRLAFRLDSNTKMWSLTCLSC